MVAVLEDMTVLILALHLVQVFSYLQVIVTLLSVLLVSPVNSVDVSLDSGPLCPGQTAVLTCNIPGGISLQWIYNSIVIGTIRPPNSIPSSDPIPVNGVEFTVSLLSSTGSDLVSEINFEVSSSINGRVLRCSGLNDAAVGSSEVILQEENSVGELLQ